MNRTVLAADLAKFRTGWVVLDIEDQQHPMLAHGVFEAKAPRRYKGAERDRLLARHLGEWIKDLCLTYDPILVAYEVTDWHQQLVVKGSLVGDWLNRYKRERVAQAALGFAKGAFIGGIPQQISVEELGAREVKEALDAKKKSAVARRLYELYPDEFRWHDKEGSVSWCNNLLSHDETDAIALGIEAIRKLRLRELICSSER